MVDAVSSIMGVEGRVGDDRAESDRIAGGRARSSPRLGDGGINEDERIGVGSASDDWDTAGESTVPTTLLGRDSFRGRLFCDANVFLVVSRRSAAAGVVFILTHSNTTSSSILASSPAAEAATTCAAHPSVLRLAHFLTVQVYPIGRVDGCMG